VAPAGELDKADPYGSGPVSGHMLALDGRGALAGEIAEAIVQKKNVTFADKPVENGAEHFGLEVTRERLLQPTLSMRPPSQSFEKPAVALSQQVRRRG
jgi:hypothetical protein